jgi:hypothetical protein
MKMPFLRAATRNLSPELSAQSKDFNLKRLLSCRGNHGRLFQQNRSFPAGRDGAENGQLWTYNVDLFPGKQCQTKSQAHENRAQ